MDLPEIDFTRIRSVGADGKRGGFEQFVCELAAFDRPAHDAAFIRLQGAGGDGGVECFWSVPNGSEQGWQAKYWTLPTDVDKSQLDNSVKTALEVHPKLTRYSIALPVDPSGPTSRRAKSLLEKIIGGNNGGWRAGWARMAADRGMAVEFEIEWRADLIRRLHDADPSGVRTRYWFDADVLPELWWQNRWIEALEAARPRYIPELNVPVMTAIAIAALCGDPEWTRALEQKADVAERCLSDLRRDATSAVQGDLNSAHAAGRVVVEALSAWRDRPDAATRRDLTDALEDALRTASDEERREAIAMETRHGPGWDTVGWRQFQAEYQVGFPAAPVDSLRAFVECLGELTGFVRGPIALLPGSRAALVIGAAGVGKTFVACDTISQRLDTGRPSVLVHGRWFRDEDPLIQLRDRLDLPPDLTGEETLGLLDQAGRTAGSPVLLVVDALNETVPRRMWRDHLDRLIPVIERYDHLRVVFTVRTHFRDEVIPDEVQLPTIDHRGFEGVEFEAIAEYADYYGLEPPASPPMHGEFDNPLYLRLLCEALRDGGRLSLDQAGMGLGELVRLLLDTKNKAISSRLSAPRNDRIVQRAIGAIAGAVGNESVPWLTRSAAQELVTSVWPDQTAEGSLLEALISEGLLAEDFVPDGSGYGMDVIVMAFERLGHHIILTERLKDMASAADLREALSSGDLRRLLGLSTNVELGLLEALSVSAVERFGIELTEFADVIRDDVAVVASIVAGLPWRNADTIGPDAGDAVRTALSLPETFHETMETLVRLATKPDHPMNADWLGQLLAPLSMANRDAFLLPWLHETHDTSGAVDRLVRWGRERDLGAVGPVTCRLWVSALLWCTGSSDRRIRDSATVAATRLLARHPSQAKSLVEWVVRVDDDWILERTLDITYAALLRSGTHADWTSVATLVWEEIFAGTPPPNAAIRDAARAVLEAAKDRGALPRAVDSTQFRPPYDSSWPIDWPDQDAIAEYDDIDRYPRLVWSCTEDDFFVYQISWILRDRPEIDPQLAARRIVLDVINLGYDPDRHGRFDRYVFRTFGGGRGKPPWMERIGKKYQWIALARLVGVVTDHTTRTPDPWEGPPPSFPGPQAPSLRQLDPTVCEPAPLEHETRSWVPPYEWTSSVERPDEEWVLHDDIPDVAIDRARLAGHPFIVLAGTYDWEGPKQPNGNERGIWVQITTVLVATTDLLSLLKELDGRDLGGHSLVRAPVMTTGFVGEYPTGIHYGDELHRIGHETMWDASVPVLPGTVDLLGEYEYAPEDLSTISVEAPGPSIFGADTDAIRWDGQLSWRGRDGAVVARVRQIAGRNNELIISEQWVDAWLRDSDHTILWLEVAGKGVIAARSRENPGRLLRTRVRYRTGTRLEQLPPVRVPIAGRRD